MSDPETIFSSITPPGREWTVGTNNQHRAYLFDVTAAGVTDHSRYVIVHGYNVMADDRYMDEISGDYPDSPILYRAQIGVHHDGPPDGRGGWRVRFPGSRKGSMYVPFEDLLAAGITLT